MPVHTLENALELLQKHFGYTSFRPLQEKIIGTVLEGKDVLAVMPTGAGKSLCFQLPALCLDGITLVISPLISLMKDQVDGLRADGIAAAFLNSSQSMQQQTAVTNALRAGEIKLLYVAPERIAVQGFQLLLKELPIRLIAIDEAHCISEWGHEFRPEYRMLKDLRQLLPAVPCIALTATATPRVRDDIREQMGLKDAPLFLSSFNRENLVYHVYPKKRAFERLILLLKNQQRLPAIVFCFSRKDTEALAADLRGEGFSCIAYHAGLDPKVRQQAQEKFMRDEVSIVAATIAFGMGIDKPDVRTVVHMDVPKTIESYYQETGRAGRDGLRSDCVLFYSFGDSFKQEFFINQIDDAEQRQMAHDKLKQMVRYCDTDRCRRIPLLGYFGEEWTQKDCNACDRCLQKGEAFDATEIAQKILSAVIRTGERFGGAHVCDVLRGKNTERIRAQNHHTLPVFGIVKDFDDQQLRDLVKELLKEKLLRKSDGDYPTLSVTDAGKQFLKERRKITLRKPDQTLKVIEHAPQEELPFDQELFDELRVLRRSFADKRGVAAFVIFGDRTLREMATHCPRSPEAFRTLYGISDRKYEEFGEAFLAIIRKTADAKNLPERERHSIRGVRDRRRVRAIKRGNSTYTETRLFLEQGFPLSEIAETRDLKESTIIEHLEHLSLAGVLPDITHLKPPPAVFDELAAAIKANESEALSPIFEKFGGKYSYDVIRLVRIFLRLEEKK